MLMLQRLFLFFAILFFSYHTTYGQSDQDTVKQAEINKNTFHATIGFAGVAGAYTLSYERMLVNFKKGSLEGLWAKASYGGWGVWSAGGPYQSVTVGILTGARNSHFELSMGGARLVNNSGYEQDQSISDYLAEPQPVRSDYIHFNLVGALGYRYQKPGGNFLFRSGIAYPETLYVGVGVAF